MAKEYYIVYPNNEDTDKIVRGIIDYMGLSENFIPKSWYTVNTSWSDTTVKVRKLSGIYYQTAKKLDFLVNKLATDIIYVCPKKDITKCLEDAHASFITSHKFSSTYVKDEDGEFRKITLPIRKNAMKNGVLYCKECKFYDRESKKCKKFKDFEADLNEFCSFAEPVIGLMYDNPNEK